MDRWKSTFDSFALNARTGPCIDAWNADALFVPTTQSGDRCRYGGALPYCHRCFRDVDMASSSQMALEMVIDNNEGVKRRKN